MPSYVTDADLSSSELAFCGAVAGVVSRNKQSPTLMHEYERAVIAPLDVVKIRMQLQTHRTHFGFRKDGPNVANVKYSNITQAFRTILKEEGIRGLYKGNMPAEYLYLSYSAVEFWAYKQLEQFIETVDKNQRVPHTLKTFGSGMLAGCAATSATYPFDLLRTRFAAQQQQKHNVTVARAMINIYKLEGFKGFYRGLWPAIVQIMPYMGLLFSTYDLSAKAFKRLRDEQIVNASYKPTHDMISGAASGLVSKTIVYPFDLIRRRMQMEGMDNNHVVTNVKSRSLWCSFRIVIKQEGFRSLYKGLAPSLVKVGPANAVTFMIFEETKDVLLWFNKRKKGDETL
ncbi:mitochondrial carrier domain-containing protein [Mycotypha africana]|uniref:mitochondrial carrier domain-containing protein n=1 Tax=Mycotypha africana TaxID=64632 RepID=UPI0022FFF79F|nr:mitochondrial carrier domain-containing protein [Mycotypha africana]KAI8979405.1 mitochondrial carrier domain-containing protein [Mycotypha africana]